MGSEIEVGGVGLHPEGAAALGIAVEVVVSGEVEEERRVEEDVAAIEHD